MKQFFKTMFACVLGVFVAGLLGFFVLMFGLISAAAFSSGSSYAPTKTSVFCLSLNTEVQDRVDNSPFMAIRRALYDEVEPLGLDQIIDAIGKAKENKHIKGIYLNTDNYYGSYAISTEIRRALSEFKAAGKWIVAYNSNYSQNQYYLATVADSIFINPMGSLDLSGLATTGMFFKKALDKFGIDMQVFRVGTFKSAVEPYMVDKMSPANRKQTEEFLGSMWESIADSIASARGISASDVNLLADQGLGFMMADSSLVEYGLVSGLRYQNDMDQIVKTLCGTDEPDMPTLADVASMTKKEKSYDNKVAVLYAVGEIADTEDADIYWPDVVADINDLIDDEAIKSVVLRVNSPGGSAFGAEQIWEAVGRLKAVKPVVVSMGTYAASGGYYISCGASRIIAEPTTLTGSIGVFGVIPCFNKLMTQTLGVSFDGVKTNRFGNISIFEPLTEAEGHMIQNSVEQTYALFLNRCATGRGMSVDSIAAIAEGRVWTGADALELGLVDELGGLQAAIEAAAKLAFVENYNVEYYPSEKSLIEQIMDQMQSSGAVSARLARDLGIDINSAKMLRRIAELEPIQARMPQMSVR